jgi:uncharacterized membrane protein YbhN (UPF0104 family)
MKNGNATASASSGGGIGLFGLTFVVLLVLKLAGIAELSWFIVFLPLISAFALTIILLIIFLIIAVFLK